MIDASHTLGPVEQRDPRFSAPQRRACTQCGATQDTGPGLTVTDCKLEKPCGAKPEPPILTPGDYWHGHGCIPKGSPISLILGPVGWGDPEREGKLLIVLHEGGTYTTPDPYATGLGQRNPRQGVGGQDYT